MPKWTTADIPPQNGKLAVVTGSNSGIGFSAARDLAFAGCEVILACRDVARADQARAMIAARCPAARVRVAQLDLADLKSVRQFAAGLLTDGKPLDLLVNNAGVMAPPRRRTTVDGFELQFGVNHLGHFALTNLLLPLLRAATAARVVSVASLAHKKAAIHFDDLNGERSYKPFAAYKQSKLANLLFGFELQRRFEEAGDRAISNVVHPGLSWTRILSNGPGNGRGIKSALMSLVPFGQSADRGALPTLYAATSPDAKGGKYYGPDGCCEYWGYPTEVTPEPQAHDIEAAERLWRVSAEMTGI